MIAYFPWSKQNLDDIIQSFREGNMPTLDLELSALCEHRIGCGGCIYCDSATGTPHLDELSADEIRHLILEAKRNLDLRWLYCCGLGEPSDDPKFLGLLEFIAELNVSMSVFTNGIDFTEGYLRFLLDHGVSLLVKCDSFDPEVFGKLLGTDNAETIQSIYRTIDMAIEIGFAGSNPQGASRLALSIVPTQYNKEDLREVVRFCKDNHIFPLIGQLEYAGRSKAVFDTLALSNDELLNVKTAVEAILGNTYEIPVCPAGILGLHINNVGKCVVHQKTGLSCPWFDLIDPVVEVIGSIRETSIVEMWQLVQAYRKDHLKDAQDWMNCSQADVFGGCGGARLVSTYLKIMENDG